MTQDLRGGGREGPPPQTGFAFGVALAAGLVLGAGILVALLHQFAPAFYQPDQVPRAAACVSASALLATVLVWTVLWFSVVRRRAPQRGFGHFLILVLVLTAINGAFLSLAVLGKRQQDEAEAAKVADTKAAIVEISTAIFSSDVRGGFRMQVHAWSNGEAGVLGRATQQYLSSITQDTDVLNAERFDFNARARAMGARPPTASEIAGLRIAAARAAQATRDYWEHRKERLAAYRAAIAGGALSSPTRASALAAFDDATKRTDAIRQSQEAQDESIMRASGKLIDSLARLDALKREGASLVAIDEAVDEVNADVRRVRAAADQQ